MSMLDQPSGRAQTDWDRLLTQTDDDIARAVETDPDAAPIQTTDDMKSFHPAPARNPR